MVGFVRAVTGRPQTSTRTPQSGCHGLPRSAAQTPSRRRRSNPCLRCCQTAWPGSVGFAEVIGDAHRQSDFDYVNVLTDLCPLTVFLASRREKDWLRIREHSGVTYNLCRRTLCFRHNFRHNPGSHSDLVLRAPKHLGEDASPWIDRGLDSVRGDSVPTPPADRAPGR